jgi:hypothetical protein
MKEVQTPDRITGTKVLFTILLPKGRIMYIDNSYKEVRFRRKDEPPWFAGDLGAPSPGRWITEQQNPEDGRSK